MATVRVIPPFDVLEIAMPKVASGAQRAAVGMSHGCREAHGGHGGDCQIWAA